MLPLVLLGLLLVFFLFENRTAIDASAFFAFSTFTAIGLCGVLLFKLTRERAARRYVEKNASVISTRLSNIYNSGIIGLLYTRFDGIITESNNVFLDMIGYSRTDLEQGSISWVHMTPPEYEQVSQAAIAQLKESGVCEPFAKEYWRKDGGRVHVLLASSLLNTGDKANILLH